jgi:hypothetical protein
MKCFPRSRATTPLYAFLSLATAAVAQPARRQAVAAVDGAHHGFAVDASVYGYGRGTLLPDGSVFIAYIHTGGHSAKDAQAEAICGLRLRVRADHSGIDLLPALGP